ncbi:MAG: polyprenyl synthetase family protein [Gemmatimonadetes bacterium]|nr:polyprenyl synthetase family protein [Gemmatimonadota bacterium]
MTTTAPGFDLEAFLRRERSLAGAAVRRAVDRLGEALPDCLVRAVEHSTSAPGKLLRPILCAAAYRAAGGHGDAVYDLGAAIELVHAYSLMHDDLPCMDDAELRRGRPVAHSVFGEKTVMVAAAALIPAAALQAWQAALRLGCGQAAARRMVRELAVAAGAGGMVGGQVLDLGLEGEPRDSAELDALHARKTGALLAAALRIGGIAAGAGAATIAALDAYGRNVGLAFQVVDDILDVTASAHALGKRPLKDAALGKATYASVHGVEEARWRAEALARAAADALGKAGIHAPALAALADYVVDRDR